VAPVLYNKVRKGLTITYTGNLACSLHGNVAGDSLIHCITTLKMSVIMFGYETILKRGNTIMPTKNPLNISVIRTFTI